MEHLKPLAEIVGSAIAKPDAAGLWVRVAEHLLQFCVGHIEEFQSLHDEDPELVEAVVRDLGAEAGATLRGESGFVRERPANRVLELAREHYARFDEADNRISVVLARGIALGIDAALWSSFDDYFKRDVWFELVQGQAYPVHRWNPERLLDDSANTNPETLPSNMLGALPHLRLAGDVATRYDFVLDWNASNSLAALGTRPSFTIAVCVVNQTLHEFDIPNLDELLAEHPGFEDLPFSNHGPRNRTRQVELLSAAINRAATAEAPPDVVVIPEYGLHEEDRSTLRTAVMELPAAQRPAVVVAGTARVQRDGLAFNEGEIWFTDPERSSPFTKRHRAMIGTHSEDIAETREIRVLRSPGWAVSVLVCLDAFVSDIVRQLTDIGVNLCLVPSMSPVTTSMLQELGGLSAGSQAVVALANSPAYWEGADDRRAVVGLIGPYVDEPGPLLETQDTIESPSIVVIDVPARELSTLTLEKES